MTTEPIWGEEKRQQWWERKVKESPASQSKSELIEEWEEVERERKNAEEIWEYEEEEEQERRKALEEQEKNEWSTEEFDLDSGHYLDGKAYDDYEE